MKTLKIISGLLGFVAADVSFAAVPALLAAPVVAAPTKAGLPTPASASPAAPFDAPASKAGFASETPAPAVALASAPAAKTTLTSDQLLAEIGRQVASHFRLEGELKLDLVRPWTSSVAAAGVWQIVVDEFPNIASPSIFVRCRVLADGVVADQPIVGKTTFSGSLVESRRIDALRVYDALPSSAGDDSYIFTRDIPADHLITWHDIARRPLVRKGDVVEVTASEGRLTLSMKALAMENGARGDLVTVRNIESRKDLSGMVVDEDHVQVRF